MGREFISEENRIAEEDGVFKMIEALVFCRNSPAKDILRKM